MSACRGGEDRGWHRAPAPFHPQLCCLSRAQSPDSASPRRTSACPRCHHLSHAAIVPTCCLPSPSVFLSLDLALSCPPRKGIWKGSPRPSVLNIVEGGCRRQSDLNSPEGWRAVHSCGFSRLSDLTLGGHSAPSDTLAIGVRQLSRVG